MDFQHPHGYNRPLPPPPPPPLTSMADPHYPPPPPQSQRPPVPPPNSWHPSQFQYHPQSQHSPSLPPPYQWGPPPPPYHAPYPSHHLPHNNFPPPPPARHNPPPPVPRSYPPANWGHRPTLEYSVHTNEEDWAAKARAWAAAKAASDNQQPQYRQTGRHEEHSHYYDRFSQSADPNFHDSQQPRVLPPSYQQFTDAVAPFQNVPIGHSQEPATVDFGQSSYVHDEHLSYTARDESLAGDPTSALPQQGNLYVSPFVHWPEVPSSYSSIAGEEVAGDQKDKLYNSQSLPATSAVQHNVKPPLHVGPRSAMREESHHSGGQLSEAPIDPMDKPLEFAPHVNREHGLHMQSNYSYSDSVGSSNGVYAVSGMTSTYAWPPASVGVEPAMVVSSPVPGLSAPGFGRLPVPNFHSTVHSVGPTFAITTGHAGATSAAFPADAYAISNDRPKKASVPNWLREEIIKKKSVISSSVPDLQRDDVLEDEDVDKTYRRGDHVDSKSVDSSRSTEEEDDDEDDADAARTAAINQEIKRILTEVLLKVTDDLFDEIATKVLSEDDLSLEAEPDAAHSSHKLSSSAHAALTPKASAKVLVPFKTIEDSDDGSKKSSSGSPGNVLGLANYASDDDNEIQSNVKTNPDEDNSAENSIAIKQVEGKRLVQNGSSLEKNEKHGSFSENVENAITTSPISSTISSDRVGVLSSIDRAAVELVHGDSQPSSNTKSGVLEEFLAEEVAVEIEGRNKSFDNKKRKPDSSHIWESQNKSDKSSARYSLAADTSKGKHKDTDNIKDKTFKKEHDNYKRQERYVMDEKTNDLDDKKDQVKDKSLKAAEKENESDSKKRASVDTMDCKGKTDRENRSSAKGNIGKGREKVKDEKREKSRSKDESNSGKHRRQRSSSVDSRGREKKDNLVSYPTDSDDESSDDYKRKPYSRRRRSPSPIRARKRQVSRSPHSKHSQRRHSPYSSLESSRSRRGSRSRSPVRRKR